jgi:HK97 family phage major capsid protein
MKDNVWTKDRLDSFIKEAVGAAFAEQREASEAASSERLGSIEKAVTDLSGRFQTAEASKAEKGFAAARYVRALAAGRGSIDRAASFAKQYYKDALGAEVQKSLLAASAEDGGFIIPPAYSQELIELLYNRTAIRRLGATVVPMPTGSITIPKVTAGVNAEYVGEIISPNSQSPTLGSISMTYKKLRVTVPISNDLLRFSSPSADSMVRNDIVNHMAVKEDATFLRGAGGEFSPKGLRYLTPAANLISANATVNLANVTEDLGKLILALEEQNIPFIKPGWVFAPRTRQYLMTVRDGLGNFAFRSEMLGGTLWGFPFVSTNQIPKNLGAGTNESELYLTDYNDVLIGETSEMSIDTSMEAAYLDQNGTLVSAFANDQTVLRVIQRHDFNLRRVESSAILTAVKWGV